MGDVTFACSTDVFGVYVCLGVGGGGGGVMWPVKGNLGNTREDICCEVICLMWPKNEK